MNNQVDIALSELDKVIKVFSQKQFPEKIAKTFITGAGKPMSKWSLGNQFLVFLQESEDARGYKQWQEVGRHVKKGAKAIHILAPRMLKIPKKDPITKIELEPKEFIPICIGFRAIPLFRYEDTEGKPLKVYKPKVVPPLLDIAKKWGVKVKYDSTRVGELGSFNQEKNEIRLCTESIDTFFHELAHVAHRRIDGKLIGGQDPEQEAIAELTACVLSSIYGYDVKGYAFTYIGSYAKDKKPVTVGKMCFKVMKKVQKVLELILTESADDKAKRIFEEHEAKEKILVKVPRKKKVSKK
jgi:hypothetical protein